MSMVSTWSRASVNSCIAASRACSKLLASCAWLPGNGGRRLGLSRGGSGWRSICGIDASAAFATYRGAPCGAGARRGLPCRAAVRRLELCRSTAPSQSGDRLICSTRLQRAKHSAPSAQCAMGAATALRPGRVRESMADRVSPERASRSWRAIQRSTGARAQPGAQRGMAAPDAWGAVVSFGGGAPGAAAIQLSYVCIWRPSGNPCGDIAEIRPATLQLLLALGRARAALPAPDHAGCVKNEIKLVGRGASLPLSSQ
jgi:hypothetical protein